MRVLVVQTAHLGDLVLTTPLLRVLSEGVPDSELTLLTTPLGREVLGDLPHVRRCLVLDKTGPLRKLAGTAGLAGRLRDGRFDAAVAAQRSFRSGLLARFSGAPRRIGFRDAAGQWAYTDTVHWNPQAHAVRRYLDLAEPLVGPIAKRELAPELPVGAEADRQVTALLAAEGIAPGERLICVIPGAAWATKCWTAEGFARVVGESPGLGLRPVLVGSRSEVELCRQVGRLSGVAPAQLAGRTGIPELIALLARAELVVGNDSGPAHVAAAVGTRVISIFGPTVPRFGYTPYGEGHRLVQHPLLPCRPCHRHGPRRCPLGHFRCMREVSASQVLEQIENGVRAVARSRTTA